MKRGAPDQLTGGSKDVNPQQINIVLTQPGVDTDLNLQLPLPIPRLPTKQGKNLVIELLWVEYFWETPAIPAAGTQSLVQVVMSTNAFGAAVAPNGCLEDNRTLSVYRTAILNATSVGFQQVQVKETDDTTDQSGHGILIATDNIFFNFQSTATGVANAVVVKLGYRWKEVTLVEYIGIVQSQQ